MRKFVSIILLGLVLLTATPTAVKADEIIKLTTKDEIEKFTDDFMKKNMEELKVEGDDKIFIKYNDTSKGYTRIDDLVFKSGGWLNYVCFEKDIDDRKVYLSAFDNFISKKVKEKRWNKHFK